MRGNATLSYYGTTHLSPAPSSNLSSMFPYSFQHLFLYLADTFSRVLRYWSIPPLSHLLLSYILLPGKNYCYVYFIRQELETEQPSDWNHLFKDITHYLLQVQRDFYYPCLTSNACQQSSRLIREIQICLFPQMYVLRWHFPKGNVSGREAVGFRGRKKCTVIE